MPAFLFATAVALSLSTGAALAHSAAVMQPTQIGATRVATLDSSAVYLGFTLIAEPGSTATERAPGHAARLTGQAHYDPEPESISRGTEP